VRAVAEPEKKNSGGPPKLVIIIITVLFANDDMGLSSTRCGQYKSNSNIVTTMEEVCISQLIADYYITKTKYCDNHGRDVYISINN